MEQLLDWFHAGFELVTMGAWAGEQLVAQYNCRLLELRVPDWSGPFPAGMGLNMAVDPGWRGRGLLRTVATPVHEEIDPSRLRRGRRVLERRRAGGDEGQRFLRLPGPRADDVDGRARDGPRSSRLR